ncbi:pesticin C-terminus-like muramidase [Halodesulfovibrio aestuarii]|uniref:Pesticin C-terminus-like muramidase n=1 Tax=Halodesulfovibrio aestuarii TaxID=126333 RepID=A0ABV4JY24_9BACT
MSYYLERFDHLSIHNATQIEANVDAISNSEWQRILPAGRTLQSVWNDIQRGEIFLLSASPDTPLFSEVDGELIVNNSHAITLSSEAITHVRNRLIVSSPELFSSGGYDSSDSLSPAIEPEILEPETVAPVRNTPEELYSYHLEIACPVEKRTKYAPGYFNLAEIKGEEYSLVLKQHPSVNDKAWLSAKATSDKKRKLYYKPQSGRGSNLFACDVDLVGEKELKANEALIPVTPAVQIDERLGFPTEGYFYHFYEKKLIQEFKITDSKKECVFAVTRSYLDTLSDEIVIKQTHHHILIYWRLNGNVVTDQHLVYLKKKITAEELASAKSGTWLEEHGVKIDVTKLLAALKDKVIERPPVEPYEVKKGDSLSKIAKQNKTTLAELRKVNPKFEKSSLLSIGEKINLPDVSKSKPVEKPKTYQRQDNACYALGTDAIVPTILAFQEKFVDDNCAIVNVRSLTLCEYCGKEGECKVDIDYDFIKEQEGFILTANVPNPKKSNSGVTIGCGFDLGHHSLVDLQNMNLSKALITKFTPYLGKTKNAAVTLLAKKPLTISSAEGTELYGKVKKDETAKLVLRYNKASKVKFECLSSKKQTIIGSVSYQYGAGAPKFWGYVTTQNWKEAQKTLRDFKDIYPSRRKREADYWESEI